MLLEIIEVCLQSGSDNQLALFCEFMKSHQSIGKQKKELPKEISKKIISFFETKK